MNAKPHNTTSIVLRLSPAAIWGALCLGIILAPLLQAGGHRPAAALFYMLFAPVCHQEATRSFALFGHAWAVCHRCSGIYFGLFLFAFFPFKLARIVPWRKRRLLWIVGGVTPMGLDLALNWAGLWENSASSRFITGLIFGAMLASLLGHAVKDLMLEIPRARNQVVNVSGGV